MFGLSASHLLIFALVVLFFGPKAFPKLGSMLGKTTRNFRNALRGEKEAEFRKLDDKD